MDAFVSMLNGLLTDTFRSILKVEEQMIKSWSKYDLTISEIHLLEAVGGRPDMGSCTITDIAENLDITMASVTVGVNKLVRKGYLQKEKVADDGRMVLVSLTKEGAKIFKIHQRFHERMAKSVTENLNTGEIEAMMKGIVKLNDFFKQKIKAEQKA